jgi:hypothetical protein
VAGVALLARMRDGAITNRSGQRYKPSTIGRYELALEKHLGPVLGDVRLAALDRARVACRDPRLAAGGDGPVLDPQQPWSAAGDDPRGDRRRAPQHRPNRLQIQQERRSPVGIGSAI